MKKVIVKRMTAVMMVSALLAASLLLGGCQSADSAADKKALEVTENAEEEKKSVKVHTKQTQFGEFTSYTQEGEEVTQEIFSEAKLTMVNIWGTFCSPCIAEMPELGELAEEYADQGFAIVGIISDVYEPGDETAQQIIDETSADYTHLVHSQDLYDNFLYLVQAVPTTVFVNSEGMRVGDVIMGAKDKEAWIEEIEARLEAVADEEE